MSNNTPATNPVNNEPSRLDWALRMAEAGFAVFPIQAGSKKPLSEGWQSQATTDPDQIKQWFANATGCNYGVALKDGQAVVDLDRKPGGADGLEAFEGLAVDHDDWKWVEPDNCPAFAVETPSGGRHLYVSVGFPVSNSVNKWAPGIDVRGTGGYVLGPGCYTDGRPGTAKGSYKPRSEAVEAPAAPEWMRDRFRHAGTPREAANDSKPLFELDRPANVEEARRYLANRAPAVEYQGGNEHTYTTFAHLHQIGISEATALELVSEEGGWNWRCEPPWDRGDLERIASNAFRYAKEPPGSRPSAHEVFTEAAESTAEGGQAADAPQDISDMNAVEAYLESELDDLPAWAWLIYDVLPGESINLWHGQPDSFKSFTVLDLACHACMGWAWPSPPNRDDWSERASIVQYEPARKLRVAYLATEGVSGLRKRVRAWKKHHGVTDDLDLVVVPDCPTFDKDSAVFDVIERVRVKLPAGVDWVIVDTLFGISGGLDVTSAADSSLLFERFKRLKVHLRCAVTIVHHNKKGSDDDFGSQVWRANVDMRDRLTGVQRGGGLQGVKIENQKTKDDRKRRDLDLTMRVIDLGLDERQRAVSSLVPVADLQMAQKAAEAPEETRVDIVLRLVEGQKRCPIYWVAERIVDEESTGISLTPGQREAKVKAVRKWLRENATKALKECASRAGPSPTDPWEFSDPKLTPTKRVDPK